MSHPIFSENHALVIIRATEDGPTRHSLETTARLAGVHPEMLRHYCHLGLFGEARRPPETELSFDDDALYELRRFEHYRRQHGVNRSTLRLLCALWREVGRLHAELRFLRSR